MPTWTLCSTCVIIDLSNSSSIGVVVCLQLHVPFISESSCHRNITNCKSQKNKNKNPECQRRHSMSIDSFMSELSTSHKIFLRLRRNYMYTLKTLKSLANVHSKLLILAHCISKPPIGFQLAPQ